MGFNIVLIEPEIPNNTGNIGRTCVATNSTLHLVHPLGFEISDKRVKRAGLDYWNDLKLREYQSLEDFLDQNPEAKNGLFFTSQAERSFYDYKIGNGTYLIFGKESVGLSDEIKNRFTDRLVKIPFPGKVRSFNLGNAVAMALGEGLRQASS